MKLIAFHSRTNHIDYLSIFIEDVAFSSHTDGGKLKYTIPSIMQIHGKTYEDFDQFEYVTYDLTLLDFDAVSKQVQRLQCESPAIPRFCQVTFHRAYTPILYNMLPPVIYDGSPVSFWLDPRQA